jgi:signal transduction histidine kinase
VLPITVGDDWLGVIAAVSQKQGYFDERKLHLYQSLAEQGAMALLTGQLFDETQHTAERLREIDRVKGEFMASMSHELRTPLNSIIGFAEIMLMGIDGELPAEVNEDVQAIFDNGQHLLNLINDVLDLTKIEAGYLALHLVEVPIEPLIETVKDNAAGLLLSKPAVEFVVEIEDAATLPSVQGDEVRLTQILNNLISNAVKFTDEGPVTLRAYQDRPDWICLEVEDSGIGISEDDLEKVFDRFHQVDSSESRSAGGTGLGLPITRHLIELHGGTIDARSQLGVGSTFSVHLPAFVPEVQAEDEDV